ncbi:TPA: phage tail protein [Klebsiella quasipneumoniae]|nr:phage tail protein [Klebsiella quasipneumoniae]HDS5201774.1 phage tail protein [Klebsiella pneumoniae]HCD8562677.1 phage tail protein [Klebsiella quasipneumoniae]HDG7841766.1 phage tail protein [Klebsiella quasipneumoniae]HDG7913755.1 phage tail protein [Klebsiella quasipneumoniae]
MTTFYTALTQAGQDALANAALTGVPVGFSWMGVGDGDGGRVMVTSAQTGLVNEKYRAPLNRLVIADQGANIIRAEMIMPPEVGGFWLREAALYDDEGVCLAVASVPDSYKPMLTEGSGRLQAVNLWIAVANTADVLLKTDPTVILATRDEVARAENEAKDYTDDAMSQLNTDIQKSITDAIVAARRDFWEEENPPGTVRFFAQYIDPNEKWPWSRWTYTGENKTIRVGKADGSNVGATGGSDTVTLQQANLPAVQINVTGWTDEHQGSNQETTENGAHNHQGGDGAPGASWRETTHGTDNQKSTTFNNTSDEPAHKHGFNIPPHSHTVTGKTDNLGNGQAINVVEAHTLLMCWARVA